MGHWPQEVYPWIIHHAYLPNFIDLNPHELHYYPFTICLDRYDGSCNTVEDPFGRICVSKKIGDVNFEVFNIKKGINESKILI